MDKKDLLKIVGLINLGEKESKKPFSQEDLRLLSIISRAKSFKEITCCNLKIISFINFL